MLGRVALIAALCGCGRISFESTVDGGRGDGLDAPLACIAGYLAAPTGCYRFETANDQDFLGAELLCEADGPGAHLVVVDNDAELVFLDSLVPLGDVFLGTSDRIVPETYVTVTGSPAFIHWDVNQPDDAGGPEYCIVLVGATMHDDDCNVANEFVCEYDGVLADPSAF